MTQEQFHQILSSGLLILDGATGTHLQASGMPSGVCPETWALENPEVLQNLQRAYFAAGSQIVYTFTFGANRPKLSHYHPEQRDVTELNRQIALLSISVRDEARRLHPDKPFYVAGDLAPTGQFLFPAGDLTLSELIDIYREQVRGLLAAGVDLFVAETIMDQAEARAAVLAVREECSLPIMVSLTVEANGRTLAGNSLTEGLLALTSVGADAFGVNCSFGPEMLGDLLKPLLEISPVPLLVKPNAGRPTLVDGRTVFPMTPQDFALATAPLANQAVRLIGGCCGSSPEHIRQLQSKLTSPCKRIPVELPPLLSSSRETWLVSDPGSLPVIEYSAPDNLVDDVFDAIEDDPPAVCIELNGASAIPADEDVLLEAVQQLQVLVSKPLIFKSENPALIRRLIRHYNGRAGIMTGQSERITGPLYL